MSGKRNLSLQTIFGRNPFSQRRSKGSEKRDSRGTTSKSTAGSSTDADTSLTTKTEPVPSVVILRSPNRELLIAPPTKTYLQMLEGHSNMVVSVVFSPKDELIASASS